MGVQVSISSSGPSSREAESRRLPPSRSRNCVRNAMRRTAVILVGGGGDKNGDSLVRDRLDLFQHFDCP